MVDPYRAGALLYHASLGAVIVVGRTVARGVVIRPADDDERYVVQPETLQERRIPPRTEERARHRSVSPTEQALRKIDSQALRDVKREAKNAVQTPRAQRGGGSFERNRSRH
jgi:hypothetical protein